MKYNWEGDCIIQGSVAHGKRYVWGNFKQPIKTDIREFVAPQDDAVSKDILRTLVREKGLPTSKEHGDFDKRAMVIWDYVARIVRYEPDFKSQRKGDFWLFPAEVDALKQGDCEDGSFLLASLLMASGISPFNIRVALGELVDKRGKPLGGHCWPMYKNEAGTWCILESTFERAPWGMPAADDLADGGDVAYVPHFCFNNHHLWSIYHEKLKNFSGGSSLFNPKVSKNDKSKLLNKKGWDLSIKAFTEYKGLAARYEKVMRNNPRVQWPRGRGIRRGPQSPVTVGRWSTNSKI